MSNAPTTAVVADALEAAAGKLDALFDDTSAFDNLDKFHDLQAGPDTFDSANWLEALVDDRLKGLRAHGEAMQVSITDLAEKLRRVAARFREADDAFADSLQTGAVEIIDTWVGDTVDYTFDEAENTDVVWQGPDTQEAPHGDRFDIDKGAAVYDKDGNVKVWMPDAEGLDYAGEDPGGIFREVNEDGDGEDIEYKGGFIADDVPDKENKEGARNERGEFDVYIHRDREK